jgi:hypothetical protein
MQIPGVENRLLKLLQKRAQAVSFPHEDRVGNRPGHSVEVLSEEFQEQYILDSIAALSHYPVSSDIRRGRREEAS